MSGAFAKNPARAVARANEPRPSTVLGDPPAAFLNPHSPTSLELLGIWRELESQAIEGVLTGCDRFLLEAACRIMYRVRRQGASTGDFANLRAYLGEMGLSPGGRTRIDVKAPKPAQEEGTSTIARLAQERFAAVN